MKVRIEASSYFKSYIDDKKREMQIEDGVNAQNILELLGIPFEMVGFVTVDGQKTNIETPLKDGQTVGFYPFIIGG